MSIWDRIMGKQVQAPVIEAAVREQPAQADEQRFHVSQEPPGWIVDNGQSTASGVTVDASSALTATAVYGCVRILGESEAALPLILYRKDGERKERATDLPLYTLLHDDPNDEMTSFELRETLMGHLTLRGNAYGNIERDNAGRVIAIWPLNPDKMEIERVNGDLLYIYTLPEKFGAEKRFLRAENVLHLRGLGSNGLMGISPIEQAAQAIGLSLASEEFGARFYGNGARPGMILEHPAKLGDEAYKRLKNSWEERHQGLDKSHRVAVLEEGLKAHELGIAPNEAQFLETRRFQVSEIARIFRVPPHMLADLERATFSNIEHQSIEFVMHTMMPWFVRWEQRLGKSLLTQQERKSLYFEHLVDGLLRGDITSRYQAYSIGRQNGWLSANDVRRMENMNPIEDGDIYLVPIHMIPADQASGEAAGAAGRSLPTTKAQRHEDTAKQGVDEDKQAKETRAVETRAVGQRRRIQQSQERIYREVAGRVIRREASDVMSAARRMGPGMPFQAWLGEFYREHEKWTARQMRPVNQSHAELIAGSVEDELELTPGNLDQQQAFGTASPTVQLERFVDSYTGDYAARHVHDSRVRLDKALKKAVDENLEFDQALYAELEHWEDVRPDEIASEEGTRAGNAAAKMLYALAGLAFVRWVTTGRETCPYCNNLAGRQIGVMEFWLEADEDFQPEGAERPLRPGSNIGHPPAHPGCDCLLMGG